MTAINWLLNNKSHGHVNDKKGNKENDKENASPACAGVGGGSNNKGSICIENPSWISQMKMALPQAQVQLGSP